MILRSLSNIFSAPIIAFLISILFSLNSHNVFLSAIIGVLFLSIGPVIGPIYRSVKNKIPIDIPEREMRTHLFIIAIISYAIGLCLSFIFNEHLMFVLFLGYLVTSTLLALINLRWKISVHTSGIAGPTTAVVYVFGLKYVWLFVFTLLVIYIRKKLNAHSYAQLIFGAILSFFITWIIYFYML